LATSNTWQASASFGSNDRRNHGLLDRVSNHGHGRTLFSAPAASPLLAQILTPEMVVDLRAVTSVAMQPQREYVAYTLSVPCGRRIAFLGRRPTPEAPVQVHALPLHGGEAAQLSHAPSGVQRYALSPNGLRLAYTTLDSVDDASWRLGPGRPWTDTSKL
jgi:hypothetical protein